MYVCNVHTSVHVFKKQEPTHSLLCRFFLSTTSLKTDWQLELSILANIYTPQYPTHVHVHKLSATDDWRMQSASQKICPCRGELIPPMVSHIDLNGATVVFGRLESNYVDLINLLTEVNFSFTTTVQYLLEYFHSTPFVPHK